MNPVKYSATVARSDAELLLNVQAAMVRGLPEIEPSQEERPPLIVAASGPSIAGQVDRIRSLWSAGAHILAIRGAHDFLIENGIIPDYALTVDPLPESWRCFSRPLAEVVYWIAAQCDAAVFEHLKDCNVRLWYPFIGRDVKHPPGKLIIAGGSTSGLRGLSVAYVRGYRNFHLFGFDSCLSGSQLRVDGSGAKPAERILEISLQPKGGEIFRCNGAMAHQAQQFETYYDLMPDATFKAYGYGLIPATIAKRDQIMAELASITPQEQNDRVSFIHSGGPQMASYRYRAAIPAATLGASVNDRTASTLIFAKPHPGELVEMARAKRRGQHVIVDFCDDHFDWPYYMESLKQAETVTCNTEVMRQRIAEFGREATVIPDPYEFPGRLPHFTDIESANSFLSTNEAPRPYLLWFGHMVNKASLERVMTGLGGYVLRVVSNFGGTIPWSYETMLREFAIADIVILPATESYKSANRAVESIRQGCFVVAEPHAALEGFPGIWIGNIKEGIEWAKQHSSEANQRTSWAQRYVTERFTPRIVAAAWKQAIQRPTTSDAGLNFGLVGSVST